ncbi:MAG: DUF6159 family protein [Promethearchaeota archaeon]
MANAFSRSWQITKLSFGVIKKDKEIILYPLLAAIFSIIYLILMLFPTIIVKYLDGQTSADIWGWAQYLIVFMTYLGLAIISTFFNVCIVYTAKTRFEGGNATFGSSLKFAFKKFHLIIYWGIVAATVNLVLNAIRNSGKQGTIENQVARGVAKVGETAWKIVTIFVIPGLVYHELTPFKAIKKSVQVLKKTWGESLIRYFGLGLIKFLFFLLGVFISIGLGYLLIPLGTNGIIALAIFVVLYFMILFLVFNAANHVFNTALYYYAENGRIPPGFNKDVMENAFKPRKAAVAA